MRSIYKGSALVLAGWLAGSSLLPATWLPSVQADERSDYENRAAEYRQKGADTQERIATISEEKRVLDEEAEAAIAEHEASKAELAETESRMAENQRQLDELDKDYDKQSDRLGKRVRDIYINGQISYLDVLFGAKDFSDFMTRMDLLKRVIKQDYDLVQTVLSEKSEIESKQADLEKDRVQKAEQEKKTRAAREQREEKVKKRQALLDKLKTDKAYYDRMYDEMMAASRQVTRMIQGSAQYSGTVSGGGTGGMIWPISGPVTSEFGWRVHPITGTQKFHSGIDIGGDYGQPIRAAQGGTVTYAGWISGYGNAVIINHGSGVTTLYGHNQSLAVSVGQSVSQGQVIAYCGSTGNSTGPHCHFEVRQNGEPVSPYGYM